MTTRRDEQADDDRDRFLRFIGYRTDKPRWRSNLEALAVLAIALPFVLHFLLG